MYVISENSNGNLTETNSVIKDNLKILKLLYATELEEFYLVPQLYYYLVRKIEMEYRKPQPIIDKDSEIYWESAKDNKLMMQQQLLLSRQKTGETLNYHSK